MTSQQYLARIAELEEHNAELRDQVRSLQSLSKVSWARMLSQASVISRSRFLSDPRAPERQSTIPVQENENETESHDSILVPAFRQSSTVSSYGSLRQLMTADEVSRPLGFRHHKSSFSSPRRDLLGFCSIVFMLVCLQLLLETTENVNRIYGNPIFLQWISGVFLLVNIIPAYICFAFSNRPGMSLPHFFSGPWIKTKFFLCENMFNQFIRKQCCFFNPLFSCFTLKNPAHLDFFQSVKTRFTWKNWGTDPRGCSSM